MEKKGFQQPTTKSLLCKQIKAVLSNVKESLQNLTVLNLNLPSMSAKHLSQIKLAMKSGNKL